MKKNRRSNRLLVVSLDAVGEKDLSIMREMPYFGRYLERAALCPHVTSVYPSLTYPAHATIVTGRTPARHGIVNNLRFQPEREKPDWFWQRKYVKGTTLYDQAERAGLKTAAFLWPVTGGARITWNLPEIWANRPWQNQILVSVANGTPAFQWELYRKFGHLLDGVKEPALDEFAIAAFCWSLKKYRPDVAFLHLTDVDSQRHDCGVESREAMDALARHDQRLGRILQVMEELGWQEDTNLVLLGDHYQLDTSRVSYPNYYLKKLGWLSSNGHGIQSWSVLARECGGSCAVYVKDRERLPQVEKWLRAWMARPDSPVSRIFTAREAKCLGADPACAFVLEAREGWYFRDGTELPMEPVDRAKKPELHLGNHGFHPDREGYQTFFAGSGPGFAPGARVQTMNLTDEGPTLAAALGIPLPGAEGKAVEGLLR